MNHQLGLLALICALLLQGAGCKANYLETAQIVKGTPTTIADDPIDIPIGHLSACTQDVAAFALEIGTPVADEYAFYGGHDSSVQSDHFVASIVDARGEKHDLAFYYFMDTSDRQYVVFKVNDKSLLSDGSRLRFRSDRALVFRRILLMCYRHSDTA